MRITWVTRSFLDYRIPVYKFLDDLCGHELTVIYNGDVVPQRCQDKLETVLGKRAIPMHGEIRIWKKHQLGVANKGIRIPIQKNLIKTIKRTSPDVLISDGFFQWTYAPLLLKMKKWKGVKHIMCYEKTPHTERNAAKWRLLYRKFVSRWIDAIDCNGSLTKEFIEGTLGYTNPLAYGHMVADTAGMAKNVENTTEDEIKTLSKKYNLKGLTFVYVGRIIPLKGIMELLRAWKEADLKDATLMMVGNGNQRQEAEQFIKNNGVANVVFTGAVNYDDLGPYYKAADCFIIPTLEDNWSLVVPEAMAAGLPIVCSIYNGCHPELVKPENGWTFDPLNIDNTVKTLKEISASRDRLKAMGEESRKIVANHTPEHAAKALYEMCLQLTGKEEKQP